MTAELWRTYIPCGLCVFPSRRRRLLLGGALSLCLVYAILVQIDPMGYGSRDAKRGAQYSALGSKGKKMVSSKAKQADSGTYAGGH